MRYAIGIDELGRAARKGEPRPNMKVVRRAAPKGEPRPKHYVIGIDEVGRGPLAGPVVVVAVAIPVGWKPRPGKERGGLKDSKKLTALQRESWSKYLLTSGKVVFSLSECLPKTIDKKNITQAANYAARKALRNLMLKLGELETIEVYLDGGLYLKKLRHSRKRSNFHSEEIFISQRKIKANTVVKGDEKIISVRVASILAKVHRDKIMEKEARRFPGYGFEKHKGYGTKSHREAISRLGPTPLHRLSFLPGV